MSLIDDEMNRLEEIAEASRERLGVELSVTVLHHCQAVNALRSLVVSLATAHNFTPTQQEAVQLITRVILSGISANTFDLARKIAPGMPISTICREIDLILSTMQSTHDNLQKGRAS